ncbi:MAG: hypothetical protein K6B14_00740 [Lachnospiraceae bacterium]|nr:hypothetical protein [Lachnospiraceae bacterium]
MKAGVYSAKKKSGKIYYRANITRGGKHISLGSFDTEAAAHRAYLDAVDIFENADITLLNLKSHINTLHIDKAITVINFRDHHMYIKTPIYLGTGFFSYFLDGVGELKFDNDDLFYYSSHRILMHDGHLYVNDYGMQYGILARYGIKNFAVPGRDYSFANGDNLDFRHQNIIVINKYHGVKLETYHGVPVHVARIHINGEYLIGRFPTDSEAAVAYNKAVDAATDHGINKNFIQNYVLEYTPKEYAEVYTEIRLPEKYLSYLEDSSLRSE